MKNTIYTIIITISLLLISCNSGINGPHFEEEMYNEIVMSELATDVSIAKMDTTRHHNLVRILTRHLILSERQVISVRGFVSELFTGIKSIREKVKAGEATREEAKLLVKEVRKTFVVSVNSVLTDRQKILFERWLRKAWNNRP